MRAFRGAFVSLLAGALALIASDAYAQGGGRNRGGRGRGGPDNAPKVGAKAPDFTLKVLDVQKGTVAIDPDTKKEKQVKLSELLKDQKPVALIFGSYT